jgi:hypothetical protein
LFNWSLTDASWLFSPVIRNIPSAFIGGKHEIRP